MKRLITFSLILLFLSAPLIFPFLKKGYFDTHDGQWAVIRLVEMNREVKDLQIPPRWAGFLNHGYGYPLFHFTYQFPYYVGEVFHLLGFGFVDSIKAVFIVSVLGSAISMFFLARRWWGDWGGIVASVFYLYAPFRLIDLFIRGSIGESLAFVFFPLLFLLGENVIQKTSRVQIVLFSFSFAMLFLTHNVFALLFAPVLLTYLALVMLRKGSFGRHFDLRMTSTKLLKGEHCVMRLFVGFILGVGLACYFWLPALFEQKYTVLSKGVLSGFSRFVPVVQMFSLGVPSGDLPIHIGIIHVVGFVVGLVVMWRSKNFRKLGILGALGMGIIILMTSVSLPFWQYVPLFSSVDFSWRYLGPLIFILSLGVGAIGKTKFRVIFIPTLLTALIFLSVKPLTKPHKFINKGDQFYETNDATTTAFDELMPIWVVDKPRNVYEEKVEIKKGSGTISNVINRSHKLSFGLAMEEKGTISVNTLYFPGWRVLVGKNHKKITINKQRGTIEFEIDKGTHQVLIQFTNTPIRTVAEVISILSFATLIVLLFPINTKRLSKAKS